MNTGIASPSLRELDAVALATNIIVFMEGDTKHEACGGPVRWKIGRT